MLHLCSGCFADTVFVEEGHDEQQRKFKLYKCPVCGSYIRDFYLTERETVDEAIASYRASGRSPVEQIKLFDVWRKVDY